jgi:hypothetical protein
LKLDMPRVRNAARALSYRGWATRQLGRTGEGSSVELDRTYAQVREYLGEAYATLGKFDLADEQLATIQKLRIPTRVIPAKASSGAVNAGKGR